VIGGTMSYVNILVLSLSDQGKATICIGQDSHLKEQLLSEDIWNTKREYHHSTATLGHFVQTVYTYYKEL
jgi:hypothetical protein